MDAPTHEEWAAGGEKKEWLELALLEVLKDVGTDSSPSVFKVVKAAMYSCIYTLMRYKSVQSFRIPDAPAQSKFITRVVVVRERMQSKEKEIHGEWFTEDRLKKSGEFSAQLGFKSWQSKGQIL